MTLIPISSIKLKERQRHEYGDVTELAASIKQFGILQPIMVEKDHTLVFGGRRLAACLLLGMTEIEVQYSDEIDELKSQEIELEENVRRKDLTWQENADAIARIHAIRVARNPKWTQIQTAEVVGMSTRTVRTSIQLSEAKGQFADVAAADTLVGASQRLARYKQLEERRMSVDAKVAAQAHGMVPTILASVVQGDVIEEMRKFPADSIDFGLSDPPYGVGIDEIYEDRYMYGEDVTTDVDLLVGQMLFEMYRVLKPDRFLVVFWPTIRLEAMYHMLTSTGFKFQAVPAVWYKPNKLTSSSTNPHVTLPIAYETFIVARKGDAKFAVRPPSNVFVYDMPTDRIHPLQKSVPLLTDILKMGMVGGERVLEPFSGSAACGVAAIKLGCHYLGIERDEEYVRRSNTWLKETLMEETGHG